MKNSSSCRTLFIDYAVAYWMTESGLSGTLQGGKDASQARYVSTRLEKIARAVFPQADDNVLTYLDDDGLQIEPQWYVPIASFPTESVRGLAVHFSLNVLRFQQASWCRTEFLSSAANEVSRWLGSAKTKPSILCMFYLVGPSLGFFSLYQCR
jgi:hypothetical protein